MAGRSGRIADRRSRSARLRLAATHATGAAAEVVPPCTTAAAVPRCTTQPAAATLRDVHVVTQHMMVAPMTLELTGRLLLGLGTDTTQL